MRDLRSLIALWGSGQVGAPQTAPTSEPTGIYRDANGRVYVRAKPAAERLTWPEDVPEAEPPLRGCGVNPGAWSQLGWRTGGELHWPVGTVAAVNGSRVAGLTVARWLAKRLQAREECSPLRYLSARDLDAGEWSATCGAERTLIVGDVVSGLGRPRLSAVGSLLAGRGRRSVVLLGEFGAGDEWETINTWLRRDGARMVQA